MKSVLLFLGLLASVLGQSTNVQQCLHQAGPGSLPINAYVVGCPTPPCSFAQESDVVLQIVFESRTDSDIHSLRTLAFAYIFGAVGVPYNLGEQSITCNFLTNTYCPLLAGEVVIYNLRMRIESWMPAGTATAIEFVIIDDADGTPVTCIRLPIAITPPLGSGGLDMLKNNTLNIGVTA